MFIFTFIMFFIFSSCKTYKSYKNYNSYIEQNLTSNVSLMMYNQPCFESCVLNVWDSNFSFFDINPDELTHRILKSSVSPYYCSTLFNNYLQQESSHHRLLNSNSRGSLNQISSRANYQQCSIILLCKESKFKISDILIENSENNTKNYCFIDTYPYEYHKDIFPDKKKYHFLFNKTQTQFKVDKNHHQARSITFKGRRLLSHVYYDADDEKQKSVTYTHAKEENHDDKSKNNELETEDDYGDDLYDDDDDAEEEEENQEDVLYEEEPVPVRVIAARQRDKLNRRHRRVVRAGYGVPQQRAWLKRRSKIRRSYREAREDCEDLGTTPAAYYRDYDSEEDIDLSSAESPTSLFKLVCSLVVITLIDFIY